MSDIISISRFPEYCDHAAKWFSSKWNIPLDAYLESMHESIRLKDSIPQWYIILNNCNDIIAGVGIIANDFHERTDLYPNVCALFVEPEYRNKGLAGELLNHCKSEARKMGLKDLYLVTDHTSFYERYGWFFYIMVKNSSGGFDRLYHTSTD